MAKVRRPPPAGIVRHLLERFRNGRIAIEDFTELKHWLESDVDVPENFTSAGEGELPKTSPGHFRKVHGSYFVPAQAA